jgi:Tol biopolymer transport system component
MGPFTPKSTIRLTVPKDRLDSWKEIAAYFRRDIRTVQRWERDWAMPVRRLPGGPKAGVYALRSDLDAWLETRRTELQKDEETDEVQHLGERKPPPTPIRRPGFPVRRVVWTLSIALVAAAAWYGAKVIRNPRTLILADSRFTQFASKLALQTCPAWSPDGQSIAFTTRQAGRTRLMVQALSSDAPVPVTGADVTIWGGGDPVWCRPPVWSPDSQWLYFLGAAENRSGLCRVAAGGGQAVVVQDGVVAASLSPDGRTVAMVARSNSDRKFRVWTANPPDGARRSYEPEPYQVDGYTNLPAVLFRPDGKAILAVLTSGRDNQYWLLPWPAGQPERVFRDAERSVGVPHISWMPDSHHIVFDARGPLAMASIDTERYWPIAMQDREMMHPTPSPDGSRIAYVSSLSHTDVVAVPLAGGEVRTLLGSTTWEQMPHTSQVTPQIVYVKYILGRRGIWLKSTADDSDRQLLTTKDVRATGEPVQLLMTPVFSPDAKRIAFAAISPSEATLFTIFTAGGPPVRVCEGQTPTWSPDGNWLALRHKVNKEMRLAKVRIGSGQPPEDLAISCGQSMPEWSPSGEWIAFSDQNCETALIHTDGGERRVLGGTGTVAWSRDGRTLYRLDPTKHALIAVNIASGDTRVLRDVGDLIPYSGPQPGLRASLTMDGKSIVYSILNPREEIWILEDVRIQEPWYARLLALVRH